MTTTYSGESNYVDTSAAMAALSTFLTTTTGLFTIPTVTSPITMSHPGSGMGSYSFTQWGFERNGIFFWIIYNASVGMYTRLTTTLAAGNSATTWYTYPGAMPANAAYSHPQRVYPFPTGGTARFYRNNNMVTARFTTVLSGDTVNSWMSIGSIDKTGSWTGGELLTSSFSTLPTSNNPDPATTTGDAMQIMFGPNGSVYPTSPTAPTISPYGALYIVGDNKNFGTLGLTYDGNNKGTPVRTWGGPGHGGAASGVFRSVYSDPNVSPNGFNGRATAGPITLWVRNWNSPYDYRLLGTIPGVRAIQMYGLTDEQVINTDWHVFPLIRRGAVGITNVYRPTRDFGYAIKFQ